MRLANHPGRGCSLVSHELTRSCQAEHESKRQKASLALAPHADAPAQQATWQYLSMRFASSHTQPTRLPLDASTSSVSGVLSFLCVL